MRLHQRHFVLRMFRSYRIYRGAGIGAYNAVKYAWRVSRMTTVK